MKEEIDWERRCKRERNAREQAEQLLESKSIELYETNQAMQETLNGLETKVTKRTTELRLAVRRLKKEIDLRWKAEKKMMKARDTAIEASSLKTRFLAGMSHEIRTPLNAIIGFTGLLLDSKLDERQHQQLNTVKSSSILLLRLINDILDLSKIEADKIDLEYSRGNLESIVKQSLSLLMLEAERKGVNFEFSKQRNLPEEIILDSSRTQQLLLNVLSNAVKYSEKGTVRLKLSLQRAVIANSDMPAELVAFTRPESCETAMVTLSVQDEGIGIKADDIKYLFDPFTQFEGNKPGSTGLGLSICKKLSTLMGGDVSVESEYGVGSTFVIRFPCFVIEQQDEFITLPADTFIEKSQQSDVHSNYPVSNNACEIDDESSLQTDKLVSSSKTGFYLMNGIERESMNSDSKIAHEKPLSILLADDHKVNRMVQNAQLEQLGYRADSVANGEEVLRALFSRPYDVILMDVLMPVMDGVECTQRIRANKDSHQPFIAAVTASALADDRQKFNEAGMNAFISKPVDIEKLAEVLEQAHSQLSSGHSTILGDLPDEARIDYARLYSSLGSAADKLLAQVIPVYLRELPARETSLRNHFAKNDAKSLAKVFHGLKGSCASFGADGMAKLCGKYEDLGYREELPSVKEMDFLLEVSAHTAKQLRVKLKSISAEEAKD